MRELFINCLVFILLLPAFSTAQTKPQAQSSDYSKNQTDKVDSFVREKMKSNHIPGLSLAVVRDGKILIAF